MPARFRGQAGFTLVEILIAMTLMAVGVTATLGVFGSAGRTTVIAQQNDVAAHQAQAEVDRLSRMSYDTLGMTSVPASSTNPRDPRYRVSGSTLQIRSGLNESFVVASDPGQSGAAVDPGPDTFSVGLNGSTITGKLYRFVTWRDENCPAGVCDGTQNTKRISVAVTIDPVGTNPTLNPVWVSTIIPDPDALAPGASAPSAPSSSTLSAQDFYLYDTRCGNTARQSQVASHFTHATAGSSTSSSTVSVCENTSFSNQLQPDLMGSDVPPGDDSTPLYKYSSDLSGSYGGGLAMKRFGTTCRTSYNYSDTFSSTAANLYTVHAWASNKFATTFSLEGLVTISLYTETVGAASGRGFICATLIDRVVNSGIPTDTAIGSTTYDLANWPSDPRRVTFSFNVTGGYDIPANHRLLLVINVRSESDNDLVFLYDHPTYPSFLEVATSTPL